MKKKISLRNTLMVLIPLLAAAGALAVFSMLPKDSQYVLEGTVEIASTTCFTQVGGTVETVLVQTGQPVRQGDVLAIIDDSAIDEQVAQLRQMKAIKEAHLQQLESPSDTQALLAARRAAQDDVALCQETLAQAQRTLSDAQQDLADQQLLYDAGAIAKVELQQYEKEMELAQSQVVTTQAQLSAARNRVEAIQLPTVDQQAVAAAQADLDLTQLQIDQLEAQREHYIIRAAADGVVISTSLEASATVAAGQGVFRLSNGEQQYFVAYLPQEYLDQVSFGTELSLFHQGAREEAARATVSYIDLQAVYPPEDYENDGNRNQRSVKIKAELSSGGPFAVGQSLFLRLNAVQD